VLLALLCASAVAADRRGTSKADHLTGTPAEDHLFGEGGRDVLRGLGGDDVLDGGPNADRVDGKNASDIVADTQAQLPFAQVSSTGALGADRGVASAARDSTGVYTVVFNNDVSKCAYNATVVEDGTQQGFASVQSVDAKTLRVRVHSAASGNPLADRGFHLTATC